MQLASEQLRILSNYIRLGVTFFAGLLLVRLVAEIDASVLVLYLLILASTGFAQAFKVMVQESVIPVLGLSYEGKNKRPFNGLYWFSVKLGLLSSGCALLVFILIWIFRDKFDTGGLPPTVFLIALICTALRTSVSSITTPTINAILVSGRIVQYNVILVAERLADLSAILGVHLLIAEFSPAVQAIWFYLSGTFLYLLLQGICYFYAVHVSTNFSIKPAYLSPKDRQWVWGLFGWNMAVVIAFLLYLRYSTFLINITYGSAPTLVLGLVFLLIGYQRQLSMGLVVGLDAVVSRSRGDQTDDSEVNISKLVLRSTYIQGVFSFASLTVMFIFVEQIFNVWFGASINQGGWDAEQASTLFRVMAIGILARSLSESWVKVLGGMGLVGSYAKWLFIAAILNTIVITTVAVFGNTSAHNTMLVIALSFSFFSFVVHLLVIPRKLTKALNIKASQITVLLWRPAMIYVCITGLYFSIYDKAPFAWTATISTVGIIGVTLWMLVVRRKHIH